MLTLISAFILLAAADPVLATADDFFAAGYYDEAVTEYKRFLFFNPRSESLSPVYYRLGRACFEAGAVQAAVEAVHRAALHAPDDSSRAEYETKAAVFAISAGNYSLAEVILLRLCMEETSQRIRTRAAFFRAVACLYAYKWRTAREALAEYFTFQPDDDLETRIDSLLDRAERMKLKSPAAAMWISTFLPGVGQMYCGDWGKGVNALVLNAGFAAWVGYKLWHQYWGDAYVIYSFLWQRYYFGNRYHARRTAEERNDRLRRAAVKSVLDALEEP